jgi:pimeloyl-ACP methyl ester carboxylesterase
MLADAAPKDVGRLMIVDALPFIGTLFDPKATVASVEPQAARIRDMMAAPATAEQRAKGAGQVGAGLAKSPEAQALVARWVTASDPKVSGIATYEDMTTDMRTALPRIAAPITIVYAYDPPMLPEARAKTVFEDGYAGARRVRFVPVEGSRHFVMLDRPAAFEAALNGFLAGR